MMLLVLLSVLLPGTRGSSALLRGKEDLNIVGLSPLSGSYNEFGFGIQSAVNLALQDIEAREDILVNHRLKIKWIDTKCDMATAVKNLFDLIINGTARTFVFGDYCGSVTKPLAESMHHFNMWQVSYADGDPTLSDKSKYPNFLKTLPSETDISMAVVSLIKHFNWTTVATLFQDASTGDDTFAYTHNSLVSTLHKYQINITSVESFARDPTPNLENIAKKDSRVIVGYFDDRNAVKTLCKAFHSQMFGYDYVWILPSKYPRGWWRNLDGTNCTLDEIKVAVNGYFTIKVITVNDDVDMITVNGTSISSYMRSYEEKVGNVSSEYYGYAYDGIWLMALALENITNQADSRVSWDVVSEEAFRNVLTSTNFVGVTGEVKFNRNQSRIGKMTIMQHQDGKDLTTLGYYDMSTNSEDINDTRVYWHGRDRPPPGKVSKRDELVRPDMVINITLTVLSAVGQLLATAFLMVNIRYRNTRYIKMSSPNMNNLIIVGCILIYSSVYILRVDPSKFSHKSFEIICISRSWFLAVGFSLAFGAMFAKTWRVFNIFNAPHEQKKAIKDHVLFLLVAGLVALDLILLITWLAIDPLKCDDVRLAEKEDNQVLITPILRRCRSAKMDMWVTLLYAYKGALLVAGCWFAWQTRHVSIPALNDSKYIGISVYNAVIICASAVAISFIIKDQDNYAYLIVGLLIIYCTTVTLCLVFVPKIVHIKKADKSGKRPRVKLKLVQTKSPNGTRLQRERSKELEAKVSELKNAYDDNQFKLQQLDDLLNNPWLENMSHAQLTATLASISSISSSKKTVEQNNVSGNNLLTVPLTVESSALALTPTSSDSTMVTTGTTLINSDVSLRVSDENEDESRYKHPARIKDLANRDLPQNNTAHSVGRDIHVRQDDDDVIPQLTAAKRTDKLINTTYSPPASPKISTELNTKINTIVILSKEKLDLILNTGESTPV